jgi:uncharacterized protein (TIGR01777 family)
MDVAVTGASGFVGSALVPALEADGHRVVRAVRPESAKKAGDTLSWDPVEGRIDAAGLEGIDAVIHLAGAGIGDKKWTPDRKRLIHESRVKGTTLLCETLAGLTKKPAVLVSASAVGYYGPRGDEILTEESDSGAGWLAGVVRDWEQATAPAEAAGIRVVRTRSGAILSADGGILKRMLFPFKAGVGGRVGKGTQYMSWITLDDEIGAFRYVLAHEDLSGPVNVTAPNPVTNTEFTKALGSALHRPTAIPTPVFLLKIPYGLELVFNLLLSGQRVVPSRLQQSGYRFEHEELEPALRDLLGKRAA